MRTWDQVIDEAKERFRMFSSSLDLAAMGRCIVWDAVCDVDTCEDCRARDGALLMDEEHLERYRRFHRCANHADGCRCSVRMIKIKDHKSWRD